ncbi:MAG: hypothetical protein HOG03_23840 [Desulfobacula sp.]|jgi:hypothetical protein|uniref:hypothetical protein n=1 Tax=Desulfobacula sp. TaxID=2593537 RepID=UPI001D8B790F|nr:hypothetical protein [Desulfobacula sp.]MBT4027308.1 hypothetical protein [Desulfobacula sp.]MBT6751499.1 hypothetical protein [Desulfobacula sp.]
MSDEISVSSAFSTVAARAFLRVAVASIMQYPNSATFSNKELAHAELFPKEQFRF